MWSRKIFRSALEPCFYAHTEALTEEADDESCKKCRDDGAFSESSDASQADPAQQGRKHDERDVVDDLEVAERQLEPVRKCQHETFTGNDHGVAGDFQHDAESHDGAAEKRHGDTQRPGFGDERMSYPHADIDEDAEDEHGRQLQKLSWPERFSEQGNLGEQHESIDAECARSHGKTEDFGHHIGNAGYGRRTQLRIGDHGYAVAHEKQTAKENDPALAALLGV